MNTRLTLKLNIEVIKMAKRYARRRGTSLSAIVENYFQLLDDPKGKKYLSEELAGCLKSVKHLSDEAIEDDYTRNKRRA